MGSSNFVQLALCHCAITITALYLIVFTCKWNASMLNGKAYLRYSNDIVILKSDSTVEGPLIINSVV